MVSEIGFIGLGKMGFGMSERLLKNKIKVIAYNRSFNKTKSLSKKGAIPTESIEELISKLKSKKKIIWLMLPANVTNNIINNIIPLLSKGDILIDGSNNFYKNAETNDKLCKNNGIHFFDIGVSNGIHGLKSGYTLMIGGNKTEFKNIELICKVLAPQNGYEYFGKAGNGHYVKAIHNIIEYVYLQGIAEGIELLDKKHIELVKALKVWSNGSLIDSKLIDFTFKSLKRKDFSKIKPDIGSVTIEELTKTKNSVQGYAPAFDSAVKIRKDKSLKFKLGKRTIAAIRNEFGGHNIKK